MERAESSASSNVALEPSAIMVACTTVSWSTPFWKRLDTAVASSSTVSAKVDSSSHTPAKACPFISTINGRRSTASRHDAYRHEKSRQVAMCWLSTASAMRTRWPALKLAGAPTYTMPCSCRERNSAAACIRTLSASPV